MSKEKISHHKHLVEQVKRIVGGEVLVLAVDELFPRFAAVVAENAVKVRVQLEVVLLEVANQLLRPQDLGNLTKSGEHEQTCKVNHIKRRKKRVNRQRQNLDELVVVVVADKEGLLVEEHSRKHAPKAPDVERVVVVTQVDEQLGALEVAGRHPHVVLHTRVVELGQTPDEKRKEHAPSR